MAIGTLTPAAYGRAGGGGVERWVATSAANTAQTVSTAVGEVRRVVLVAIFYSAPPTHAGITITLNSGAGAAYDTPLNTPAANAQSLIWVPTTEFVILPDDAIDVVAPAGGGVITSSVIIVTERKS
jgi:hypothetical protein